MEGMPFSHAPRARWYDVSCVCIEDITDSPSPRDCKMYHFVSRLVAAASGGNCSTAGRRCCTGNICRRRQSQRQWRADSCVRRHGSGVRSRCGGVLGVQQRQRQRGAPAATAVGASRRTTDPVIVPPRGVCGQRHKPLRERVVRHRGRAARRCSRSRCPYYQPGAARCSVSAGASSGSAQVGHSTSMGRHTRVYPHC